MVRDGGEAVMERVRVLTRRAMHVGDIEHWDPVHETRLAAILGAALGVSFITCFATGLISHLAQHEPSWFDWTARPAGFYRVTQGLHVTTGTVSIPLLLAKLWVVYPRFLAWPPAKSVLGAIERIALLPLVGGGLFLLFSGVANVARWYPWTFFFPAAHFWAAWITIGALVVHVGAKFATTTDVLRRRPSAAPRRASALDRRSFLAGVGAAGATLAIATAGGTISALGWVSALAQRRPGVGPQGIPVNKAASQAGVEDAAMDPEYKLVVEGAVARRLELSRDELAAMTQHVAELPIACVEGWSASGSWRGVRVRDLLARAGAEEGAEVLVESLQKVGGYRQSELNRHHAHDRDTILALELNGEPLHLDHGYPLRLIGPNRPGVMQTKWVSRLVVR